MRLSDYEKRALREVEAWQRGSGNPIHQALNWAMMPFDWVVDNFAPPELIDQLGDAVSDALGTLKDASKWTFDEDSVLAKAADYDLEVTSIEDLRDAPLEKLDELALSYTSQNAIMAAVEGGGMGLGGVVLIAADIPLLFTINFRLIQQIGASYGFSLADPSYRSLLLAIYNVAASGSKEVKAGAMREVSVAAASFAHDQEYRGRRSPDTLRAQNRHVPREIAKNLIGRKMGQVIPIAGAAVGAGVNYWFTTQSAEAARMLFRAIYVERKERV